MSSKLSVAVQVDLDGRHVTIKVTAGALTPLSQQGLHAVIRRARTLTPGIAVTVDLTALTHMDASAVRVLRQALEDPGRTGRGAAVRLVLPVAAPPAAIGAGTGREVAA